MNIILSIIFSSSLFIIFKIYKQWHSNMLHVIAFNYIAAAIIAFKFTGVKVKTQFFSEPWFWFSVAMGLLFVVVFKLMASCVEKVGAGQTATASKLSIAIPLAASFLYFNEEFSTIGIIGIILSILAIWLISGVKSRSQKVKISLLPVAVFVGSGFVDLSLKTLKEMAGNDIYPGEESFFIFSSAAVFGILIIFIDGWVNKTEYMIEDWARGLLLGIPNFFSIYFLSNALNENSSGMIFTINNLGVLVLTTLIGYMFYQEEMNKRRMMGLGLAIISLLLIYY